MIKVAFDIDGCLIDYDGKPQKDMIELLRYFKQTGCEVCVWSGGGMNYIRHRIVQLGIEDLVVIRIKGSFIPDIVFDDEDVNLGNINISVRPKMD